MADIKIPKEIRIQDLREWVISRLDISSFYSQFLTGNSQLHQVSIEGWSNRVLCPLHGDQTNPNFFVNLKTGNFSCKACNKGGSAFDFWLLKNGYSTDNSNFLKALLEVARYANINLEQYLQDNAKEISSGKLPEELHHARTTAHLKQQQMQKRVSTDESDANESPIPNSIIENCQRALRAEHIKYLSLTRGLTRATIEYNRLGYMDDTKQYKHVETGEFVKGRYSIPIPDEQGKFRNIRLHSPVCNPDYKVLNYKVDAGLPTEKGYGKPPRLFGVHELATGQYKNIVIVEGEYKRMLLNQKFEEEGYNTWRAVTGTHGAPTFLGEWADKMLGCSIYFCFDCDESGKINAKKHASEIFLPRLSSGKYAGIRIVTLPLAGTKESKDTDDFFLKEKRTLSEFIRLCTESPEIVAGGVEGDEASVEPIQVENLNHLIRDRRYIDQRVTVPLTIVSAAEQTYHAIRTCTVESCPLMEKGECCQSGAGDTNIPYGHPIFIASCMEREESVLSRLRNVLCTKDLDFRQANRIRVTQKKKVVMELYYAHQLMERMRQTIDEENKSVLETCVTELAHVQVYLLQSEVPLNVEPKGYMATGWVRTHPKTSTAALFIEQMTPIEEDWRKFNMRDPKNREIIKYMKDGIKTDEILNDLIHGVTHIFDADEILLAVLLTFLSPLKFFFNGTLQRGWINTLIIGDSGVGKSATYTRFSDWVEVGSWFSALTGSRTGLIYAAKKKGDEWYIAAGDYVQASGKIIAVDEIQILHKEVTQALGNAIDRGFLEVKKVASGGYEARTRMIGLGNAIIRPMGDQATLSDFTHGCESLAVMFAPMFIRRCDIAIFISQEVNKEEKYNAYVDPKSGRRETEKLSSLQMRSLIYWAWTREPRHINFTEEATKECLNMATQLSRIYGAVDKVPLVNPNDFRENLARLSVACAVLERSIGDDLETLTVLPEHVQAMSSFVDTIYSSPSCGLRSYSEEMARINRMDDKEFGRLEENMRSFVEEDLNSSHDYYRSTFPTLRAIVYAKNTKQFTLREAMEVTGLNMAWLRRRIDHFKCLDLIQDSQRGSFQVTRKFNLFMMKWRQDPKVEDQLDKAKNRLFFQTPEELMHKPRSNNTNGKPKENHDEANDALRTTPVQEPEIKRLETKSDTRLERARNLDDPFAASDPFGDESQI